MTEFKNPNTIHSLHQKLYGEATEHYTEGLAQLPPSSGNDKGLSKELKAVLLTNRAAAALGLGNYKEAKEDCSAALALDPGREKALFRRAQANEGMGNAAEAFRDFKDIVSRDPSNRAAVAAARRCKEALEAKTSMDQTPVTLAVDRLREGSGGSAVRTQTIKALISFTHDDASAAALSVRQGAIEILWGMRDNPDEVRQDPPF